MSITIIDSIMGSGKSTWARMYMNNHPECRWWYVTPYLNDINKKVIPECRNLNMQQPEYDAFSPGSSKHDHLLKLLKEGKNIACTHKLFLSINPSQSLVALLQSQKYHIIIDESPDIITANSITQDDISSLKDSGVINIIPATNEIVLAKKEYKGAYKGLLDLSYSGNLFIPSDNSNAVVWLYNKTLFSAFETVIILTYLFNGSYLKSYFDFNGLTYQIDNNTLFSLQSEYDEQKKKKDLKKRIEIYKGPLNDIGQPKNSVTQFSHNWFHNKKNEPYRKQLYNNAYNFLHNICKARTNSALYTVFKDVAEKHPLRSYKKCFIPCNQRVTNDFRDRKYLAYLVNMYENPSINIFFSKRTSHDQDSYALESLLQWIWRSAIRNKDQEHIRIFLPSTRMRDLLINWLET